MTPEDVRELKYMTPEESIAWRPTHPGGSTDILPFFVEIAHRIPRRGTYVEIGTFFGRSLAFMGMLRPDLELVAIDPWLEGFVDAGEVLPVGPDLALCRKHGGLFPAFLATMQAHAPEVLARTRIIRAPSRQGLRVLDEASVDFCFIDGDHGKGAVALDCREALRIVKPGGVVAGHDHLAPWGNEVSVDVAEALGEVTLAPWPVAREGWAPGCSSCFWMTRPTDASLVSCSACGRLHGVLRASTCPGCGLTPEEAALAATLVVTA